VGGRLLHDCKEVAPRGPQEALDVSREGLVRGEVEDGALGLGLHGGVACVGVGGYMGGVAWRRMCGLQ